MKNSWVGVKAGDSKDATVKFPDDYGAEHLAGKEAVFACTIKAVKAPADAAIDDALAKQFGAEDLAALKSQISERLEAEYAQASRAVLKRALLDALDDAVTFDLPPSLVDAESKQIAHQLWHDANKDTTAAHDHSHGEIERTEESDKLAVRRVKLGLPAGRSRPESRDRSYRPGNDPSRDRTGPSISGSGTGVL